VKRTVCACVRGEGKRHKPKLTKVALDNVFAHANEKWETRTMLKNREKENDSQENVHTRDNKTRGAGAPYIPGGR
jgi:hypothetical protein